MVFIWYSYGIRGISWENHTFVSLKSAPKLTRIIFIQRIDRNFVPNKVTNECNKKNYPQSSYEFLYPYHSISWYLYLYIYLSLSIDLSIKVNIYYHTIYIYRMHMSTRGFFIPVPGSLGPWVVPRWKAPDHQSPPSLVPTILIFEAPEGLERGGFTVNEVDIYIYIYICLFTFIIYIYRYSDTIYVDVSMKWAYQPSSI